MFKKILKNIFYSAARFWPAKGAVILMYHSVGNNPAFFTVSPDQFQKQISYLVEKKFRVMALSQLLAILNGGEAILPRTVVITIDDGYQDNFTHIFPVLKKYHLSASIFLTTGDVGKSLTTTSGITLPALSWPEIKEMAASGLIEFYPHSHNHPRLDLIPKEQAEREMVESKRVLEKELGRPMDVFAYPFGRYNEEIVTILKHHGLRAALTVQTGRTQKGDERFKLKRNSIDSKVSLAMFKGIVRYGRI